MKVWRLVTHDQRRYKERALQWSLKSQRLAIGWGDIGDLGATHHTSWEDIRDAITRKYRLRNAPAGGHTLWDFWRSMSRGDLVILSTGGSRRAVMRVTGRYEHVGRARAAIAGGNYQHQRAAELLNGVDADELWRRAGGEVADGYSIRWTLVRCRREVPGPGPAPSKTTAKGAQR